MWKVGDVYWWMYLLVGYLYSTLYVEGRRYVFMDVFAEADVLTAIGDVFAVLCNPNVLPVVVDVFARATCYVLDSSSLDVFALLLPM